MTLELNYLSHTLCSSVSQLYQNVPAVGHCVSVLLAALGSCEGREVRSTALGGLLALSGLAEEDITLFTGEESSCWQTKPAHLVYQNDCSSTPLIQTLMGQKILLKEVFFFRFRGVSL